MPRSLERGTRDGYQAEGAGSEQNAAENQALAKVEHVPDSVPESATPSILREAPSWRKILRWACCDLWADSGLELARLEEKI